MQFNVSPEHKAHNSIDPSPAPNALSLVLIRKSVFRGSEFEIEQQIAAFLDNEVGTGNWKAITSISGLIDTKSAPDVQLVICGTNYLLALKWADIRDGILRTIDNRLIHDDEIKSVT